MKKQYIKIEDNDHKHNQNTVCKLKSILKDYEKEEETYKALQNKKEDVAGVLTTTLKLISDDPGKRFDDISTSIKEWIDCSQIEMEMMKTSLEELNKSSN